MKKLEELNLNEAEVLDRSAFMAYSYDNGSGTSGSSGSSGSSGTEEPLKNECENNSGCTKKGTYCVTEGKRKVCKEVPKWSEIGTACKSQPVSKCYAVPCKVRNNEQEQGYIGECRANAFVGVEDPYCGCMGMKKYSD